MGNSSAKREREYDEICRTYDYSKKLWWKIELLGIRKKYEIEFMDAVKQKAKFADLFDLDFLRHHLNLHFEYAILPAQLFMDLRYGIEDYPELKELVKSASVEELMRKYEPKPYQKRIDGLQRPLPKHFLPYLNLPDTMIAHYRATQEEGFQPGL